MSVSGTDHPDDDLLADLAAEVLADDLAEQVQTHVMGCERCADLLAEAEGIRSLLRQSLRESEPERMPADVLARLTATLASVPDDLSGGDAAEPPRAVPTPVTGVTRGATAASAAGSTLPGAADSTPASGSGRAGGSAAGPRRRLTPALPRKGAGDPATQPTTRLSRLTRPTESARRQAMEEQRADQPSLLTRLAPVLRIAAAVVVVLGVGGLVWQLFGNPGSDSGSASSSGSAGSVASAPVLAPVQATGTNYTQSRLSTQVDALVAQSQRTALRGAPSAASGSSGDSRTKAADDGTATPSADSDSDSATSGTSGTSAPEAAPLAAGPDLLRSPTALRACLTALGADDDQPVAVDLATYADRQAAIIVLNADGGGYDVWVVARTCSPGDDGTIANEHLDH